MEKVNKLKEHFRRYHPRYRFILSLPFGSRVLDLGCGDFSATKKFLKMRPDLIFSAVDIRDLAGFAPPGVDFCRVDIQREPLPFDDSCLDAIYCSHVLEHLYTTSLISGEIRRALKAGGRIYIETPGTRSLWVPSFQYGREQDIPLNFYDDPTHQKPFSKTGLFIFLKKLVFEVIRTGTARNPWSLLLAPYFLFRGLLFRDRLLFTHAVWEVLGWSIYAVGYNLRKDDAKGKAPIF